MMNSTTLQITTQAVGDETLLGDVPSGVFRPLVPIQHKEAVFQSLHAIHHPGVRGDPPLDRRPVLLATDGQAHNSDGQGLPALPERKGSQTRTPTANRDTGTPPPFCPHPRRPGRAAAALAPPHLPVHQYPPDLKMAGRHPTRLHHCRRLRQGPFRRLGIAIWSPSHHHIRQRGPIHVRSLGGPVQPAQHPALAHDSIPPSIKRIGLVVPQVAEGRLAVLGRRRRLARPPPLGDARCVSASFREDSEFSPAEAVFGSQLILLGQFINTAESPSSSFLSDLQTTMTGHPLPPARHNAAPAPSTLPEELLLAHFVLVHRDGAQPPLSPIYNGPYRVLEWSTHFFFLEMGDRTDKVSTLRLKAAWTPADTEPAKPPLMGRPIELAPPVRAPPPEQRERGRPRQVTFSPTAPPTTSSSSSASGRPLRNARPPNRLNL
jgi:hypothetical protein